jgi:hypothetical protein
MSAVDLTPILTIAYGNNCQGTKKGIGPNIYFGITKGITYIVKAQKKGIGPNIYFGITKGITYTV